MAGWLSPVRKTARALARPRVVTPPALARHFDDLRFAEEAAALDRHFGRVRTPGPFDGIELPAVPSIDEVVAAHQAAIPAPRPWVEQAAQRDRFFPNMESEPFADALRRNDRTRALVRSRLDRLTPDEQASSLGLVAQQYDARGPRAMAQGMSSPEKALAAAAAAAAAGSGLQIALSPDPARPPEISGDDPLADSYNPLEPMDIGGENLFLEPQVQMDDDDAWPEADPSRIARRVGNRDMADHWEAQRAARAADLASSFGLDRLTESPISGLGVDDVLLDYGPALADDVDAGGLADMAPSDPVSDWDMTLLRGDLTDYANDISLDDGAWIIYPGQRPGNYPVAPDVPLDEMLEPDDVFANDRLLSMPRTPRDALPTRPRSLDRRPPDRGLR